MVVDVFFPSVMGSESSDEEEVQEEDEEGPLSPEQLRLREEARRKLEQENETAKKAIADQLQDIEVSSKLFATCWGVCAPIWGMCVEAGGGSRSRRMGRDIVWKSAHLALDHR